MSFLENILKDFRFAELADIFTLVHDQENFWVMDRGTLEHRPRPRRFARSTLCERHYNSSPTTYSEDALGVREVCRKRR